MAMIVMSACTTKKIAYLQSDEDMQKAVSAVPTFYDARFKVKDLLTINVSCSQPEVAAPFNLTVSSPAAQVGPYNYTTSQPTLQVYQVDNSGSIAFPVLGKIRVEGMTKSELESYLVSRLASYIKGEEPTVIVKWVEYKYSVLGEVGRPGQFTSMSSKVNIFEALAQAGDMTIYGKRDNVKLIREDGQGMRTTVTLDLTRDDIVNSPYYYLEQNDIVYVEPNKARARSSNVGSLTTVWLTVTSILISAASLITTIVLN